MNKKIVIAGGTGFIGQALEKHFEQTGDKVVILSRLANRSNHVYWDGKNLGEWTKCLDGSDVLINLCGKSVDCRYTKKNRKEILNSRIDSTQLLTQAIRKIDNPPSTWLNASSATIYKDSRKLAMTESEGIIGNSFSMDICKQWEDTFYKESIPNVRKISLRMSIVLGENYGAFPKYKQITKLGLGGYQGDGKQLVSWVHIDDVCRAIEFIIGKKSIIGPVNVTSPNVIDNRNFMFKLRQQLGISFGLPQPRLLLEIGAFFIRTETELLLKSRNVYPEKLIKSGFDFKFPELDRAISDLLDFSKKETNKIKFYSKAM